jgi:hypothetical protein
MDQDGPIPKQNNSDNITEEEVYDFHFPPIHPKQHRRLTRLQQPSLSLPTIPIHNRTKRNKVSESMFGFV